ncbi:MAG: 6-pyruvoyl-tetrahydropterin synthase-related protein, partial [Candidatus Syntropharchaeia archaeon]
MFLVLLLLFLSLIYVNDNITFTKYWVEWNYEGFESKRYWETYRGIVKLVRDVPGRTYNDLSDENDKFGTPRAFELLPYFGEPTLEGVYAQATITSPFISYTQCEISHHCAGIPIVGGKEHTTKYNITQGTRHLEILNVKTLIAVYDRLKKDLEKSAEWDIIGDFGRWKVYELKTIKGRYVRVPRYIPNLISPENWKEKSMEWWMKGEDLDVPLVFTEENLNGFPRASVEDVVKIEMENDCDIEE